MIFFGDRTVDSDTGNWCRKCAPLDDKEPGANAAIAVEYGINVVWWQGKPVGTPDPSSFYRIIHEHNVCGMFTAPTAMRALRREVLTAPVVSHIHNKATVDSRIRLTGTTTRQTSCNVTSCLILAHWLHGMKT